MVMQGKFFKFCSLMGNYRNILGTKNRQVFPNLQQTAYLRKQTLEEKYHIPEQPKRPLTPYFKYMIQIRPDLKRDNPNLTAREFVKQAAKKWEKIDPQLKLKLEAEYKKEQEVYTQIRLDFDTKLTDEQKQAMKQYRLEKLESKEKRKLRQKCKEMNKPKKPCSAYVLYLKTQIPNRGSENWKEWQMAQAKKWNGLSEEQKKPFMDKVKDDLKEYRLKMVEWERQMIKMGNTDIIRVESKLDYTPKPRAKPLKKE